MEIGQNKMNHEGSMTYQFKMNSPPTPQKNHHNIWKDLKAYAYKHFS